MKYLFTFLLTIFFLDGICQDNPTDTLIFKAGEKTFERFLSKHINAEHLSETKQNAYVNVNMTINSEGKIKRIDLFSVDDTVLSNMLYNLLMQTDGGWLNSSKEDQILNIFFEFRYAENAIDKEAPIKCYSDIYEDGKLKKVTRHEKFQVIVYPTVR